MHTQTVERTSDQPTRIPAGGQDWANYIGHYWTMSGQIQAVLAFEDRLDIDLLKRAVRLSVEAEPVLGCRFVEDEQRPYWQRLDDIDAFAWCPVEEPQDGEEALRVCLAEPLALETQLQARLIRAQAGDLLCVKLNHACSDGGGLKDYLLLLAGIYTRLDADRNYLPPPNVTARRDTSRLFSGLGIKDPRMAFKPQLTALKPTWAFPHRGGEPGGALVSLRRFYDGRLAAMSARAKAGNATLNDLILTAFYRTMFAVVAPDPAIPMEICVTTDLRRHLPDRKADTICNLSGILNARTTLAEGETFAQTLDKVSSLMRLAKDGDGGLHSAASMELMTGMGFRNAVAFFQKARQEAVESGKSSPLLSNLGVIAEYPCRFGGIAVKDAYLVTPAFHAPSFMLGVSTYRGVLTFSASYYEGERSRVDIEGFLDGLQNELLSCCAS